MSCADPQGSPIVRCKRSNIAKQCSATATTIRKVDFHDHLFHLATCMLTRKHECLARIKLCVMATKAEPIRTTRKIPTENETLRLWQHTLNQHAPLRNFLRHRGPQHHNPSIFVYIWHLGLTQQAFEDSSGEHGTLCSGCLRSLLTVLCFERSFVKSHLFAWR